MENRQRNIRIQLRVTEQEKELIEQKKQELGTKNTEAYLRKMAIDGLIIHLDTADVRELVRVLRVTSNSLNQLTKRVAAFTVRTSRICEKAMTGFGVLPRKSCSDWQRFKMIRWTRSLSSATINTRRIPLDI